MKIQLTYSWPWSQILDQPEKLVRPEPIYLDHNGWLLALLSKHKTKLKKLCKKPQGVKFLIHQIHKVAVRLVKCIFNFFQTCKHPFLYTCKCIFVCGFALQLCWSISWELGWDTGVDRSSSSQPNSKILIDNPLAGYDSTRLIFKNLQRYIFHLGIQKI